MAVHKKQASKIKVVPLASMGMRYESGALRGSHELAPGRRSAFVFRRGGDVRLPCFGLIQAL
jgi:hypothetical protein